MRLEHEVIIRTRDGEGNMLDHAISWGEVFGTAIGISRLLEIVAEQNEKEFVNHKEGNREGN